MTNYREILRMNSLGFNKTEIAQSLQCSRTTVRTVIRLAEEHNLQYPLPNSTPVTRQAAGRPRESRRSPLCTQSEPRRAAEGSPSPSAGLLPHNMFLDKRIHHGVVQLQEQLGDQLFIRLPAAESAKAVRGPLRVIRLLPSLRVDLERLILRNHPKRPHTEIMDPPIMVLHSEADLPRRNLSAVFVNENLALPHRNHLRPLGRLFLPPVFQRGKKRELALPFLFYRITFESERQRHTKLNEQQDVGHQVLISFREERTPTKE